MNHGLQQGAQGSTHRSTKCLRWFVIILILGSIVVLSACSTQPLPPQSETDMVSEESFEDDFLEVIEEDDLSALEVVLASSEIGEDLLSTQAAGQGDLLDRRKMTPTAWWWLTGATPAQVAAKVNEGYRIFDLEVERASPLRLSAVLVRNSGEYASGWWWYYGQSAAQVSQLISQNQARIIDIESYYINGQKLFAVVMLPNSGATAKSWWYYHGITFSQVADKVRLHRGRLLDIDRYVVSGSIRYNVVIIPNSGSDAKAWWYYSGLSAAGVASRLSTNNARLTDIEVYSSSQGLRFNVIMERLEGETWWWYYGLSSSQVNALTAQNGARLIDVESYNTSAGKRYAVIMLRNVNDLTNTMRAYLASNQSGGAYGLYLKPVNGGALAALQQGYVFEPASTIKALHNVHAIRQVELGNISLNSPVGWFQDLNGSCPVDSSPAIGSLQTGLNAMMKNSDNRWTQAMRVRFGEANINATAQALGMTSTLLRHRIGCAGGSDGAINEPNRLTLVDITRLYDQVANGYLGSQRQNFYNRMLTGRGYIDTVINQEAAKLGLSATTISNFKSYIRTAAKAGSYGLNGKSYLSIGGWIRLPFESRLGRVAYREYSFGLFINKANSINASFSIWDARGELLREEIAKALATFK